MQLQQLFDRLEDSTSLRRMSTRQGGRGGSIVLISSRGEPAEVAAAVMFLVSSHASSITGANLAVSGGR